jgi:signal transduction histidine kinase
MIEKIKKFFSQKENIALSISILAIIILSVSLVVSSFNLLKFLNFIILIITIALLIFLIQILQKPKRERIQFFFYFIENLIDNLQEGIVIYNDEFKIIFANKAFCKLVNLEKEDLIDLVVKNEMINNERYQTLANIFFPFIQGEDLKIVNQNPETIEVKFNEPTIRYFLVSYVDIYLDKKYKLRMVLDRTKEVLDAVKRLEFLQLVTHNLLTPLNEVRWNLESIDLNTISKKEDKEIIDFSLQIIKTLIIFAESILTMVATETGKVEFRFEEINLENIIVSLLSTLKTKIEEKKLRINIEIDEKVSKIQADYRVLSIALFALIENAVLYNKTGGSIIIKAKKMPQRPYLEITIEDTGIGMSKEELMNLFQKYYRGKRVKELAIKGFGLGLYNSKRLINLYGGDIKVESQENKGTKVTVVIPLDINLVPGL